MALYDPDLIKAHVANQRAIALAALPETAIRNFEAMPAHERRHRCEVARMEVIRNDLLANRPGHPNADQFRRIADNARKTVAALKALGL